MVNEKKTHNTFIKQHVGTLSVKRSFFFIIIGPNHGMLHVFGSHSCN